MHHEQVLDLHVPSPGAQLTNLDWGYLQSGLIPGPP